MANNYTGKDASGATITVKSTDNGGVQTPHVNVDNTVAVTGTFYQATQPVSLASLPSIPAGTNNIGDVDVLTLPALAAGTNNIGSVAPYAQPADFIAGATSDITGTSNTSVIAAQGASVRIYVTQLLVTNSHATVGTFVDIKDGTTTIYTGYAAAVGGGFSLTLPVPLRLTANTALNAACATAGANVRVSASGYKSTT